MKPTFTERPVIRQSDEGNKIIFQCKLAGNLIFNLYFPYINASIKGGIIDSYEKVGKRYFSQLEETFYKGM